MRFDLLFVGPSTNEICIAKRTTTAEDQCHMGMWLNLAQPGCHGTSCADMTGHVRCFLFFGGGGEDKAVWDKATKYLFR